MLSTLYGNCASVSVRPEVAEGIFGGYFADMVAHGTDVGLFCECKDFDARELVPPGWSVETGGVDDALVAIARPGVRLERVAFTPVTPFISGRKWTGQKVKVGPRGILSVTADGERLNVGHAPLQWAKIRVPGRRRKVRARDVFIEKLAAMPGTSGGDLNAGRRTVLRRFTGRTVYGGTARRAVLYVGVPFGRRSSLRVVPKGLNGADHEALAVEHETTDPTTPTPAPNQPTTPPKEPTVTVRKGKALDTLFAEMNKRFPNRSKISDGWLGDAAHQSRDSDHNPWILDPSGDRIVSAIDVTEDAEGGFSEIVDFMVRTIVARRDERVKYLIHEGRIWRSYDKPGIPAWTPAPYTGPNAHEHHGHVSVKSEKRYYDSTKPWGILTSELPRKNGERVLKYVDGKPLMFGSDVTFVQKKVGVTADGWYGPRTAAAVERWEKAWNAKNAKTEKPQQALRADGMVGVLTWPAMGVKVPTKKKPVPEPNEKAKR